MPFIGSLRGTFGTQSQILSRYPFQADGSTSSSGGSITTSGGYRIHSFSSVGNSTFTLVSNAINGTRNPVTGLQNILGFVNIEYLVVAGGGGGGQTNGDNGGGGGGGGGVLSGSISTAAGSITITVGSGGSLLNAAATQNAARGSNSIFGPVTSFGGGFGGGYLNSDAVGAASPIFAGSNGGCSGGSSVSVGFTAPNPQNQGFSGGQGINGYGGGGGGGGGSVGQNAVLSATGKAGDGGFGFLTSITGVAGRYAGGGGGGGSTERQTDADWAGLGGNGGGGRGATRSINSVAGTNGFGGGGGGGGGSPGTERRPSNGGSGVVILRYLV
jgi:hypothetical protein